jgi:hypothetical protein
MFRRIQSALEVQRDASASRAGSFTATPWRGRHISLFFRFLDTPPKRDLASAIEAEVLGIP